MSTNTQITRTSCDGIDPLDVNAYFKLKLDELNSAVVRLETSWGCTDVDLSSAFSKNETITHLLLTPTALQYNREDYGKEGAENGGVDCIEGDDLSRIISLHLLKDVDQSQAFGNGDTLVYNSNIQMFQPFDLMTFVNNTNNTLAQHTSQITNLQNQVQSLQNQIDALTNRVSNLEKRMTTAETNITNLGNRVTTIEGNIQTINSRLDAIEAILARPAGVPTNTRLTWGNCNAYHDYTNSNGREWGLFTHNPQTTIPNDTYVS